MKIIQIKTAIKKKREETRNSSDLALLLDLKKQ